MNRSKNYITTITLRNFLNDLHLRGLSLGVRFRMLGEMWKPNFMKVVKITDRGAIFTDEATKEFVFVADLSDIVQFEIDDRHREFEPHHHYEVSPAY